MQYRRGNVKSHTHYSGKGPAWPHRASPVAFWKQNRNESTTQTDNRNSTDDILIYDEARGFFFEKKPGGS